MKRKILSTLLVLCMLVSLLPTFALAAPAYNDTTGHWAADAIDRWSGYGVVNGKGEGSFDPDGQMTRAEAAQVFANLLGLNKEGDISAYPDAQGDWFTSAIAKCVAAGILNGKGAGKMDPNGTVTREEFLTMYARAVCISNGADVAQAKSGLEQKGFADTAQVSDWAADAIGTLVDKGYVSGISATEIAPQANINRASVMALLDQSVSTYVGKDSTETTVAAKSEGITLIANPAVTTVTGTADVVVVAAGAEQYDTATGEIAHNDIRVESAKMPVARVQGENITVTLALSTTAEDATVTETGVDSIIVIESTAAVKNAAVAAEGAKIIVKDGAKAETVTVAETAKSATVETAKNATVGTLTIAAESATASVAGKVETVKVEETAKNATVETKSTAKVETVENKAENTAVTGSGTVGAVKSSEDVKVETKNTKVENTSETKEIAVTDNKGTETKVETKTEGTTTTKTETTVNKQETSSGGGGGHSHNFGENGTTKCSCGAFAADIVAAIGNQGYKTLAEAINAVGDAETIVIQRNIDNAVGISVPSGKDFTVDFKGYTYTLNMPGAGSSGTGTAGFQLIAGSTITFKNGTICCAKSNKNAVADGDKKPIKRIFQSYADLTLDNMKIDATYICPPSDDAAAEFACGNVSITNGTSFVVPDDMKAFNVDTWKDAYPGGAHVTVNTTGNIGTIHCYTEGDGSTHTKSTLTIKNVGLATIDDSSEGEVTVSVTGGTFSSDPSEFVAPGYGAAESDGKYTVNYLFEFKEGRVASAGTSEDPFLLANGNQWYDLISTHDEKYMDGYHVKLTEDIDMNGYSIAEFVTYPKNFSLDGAGHKFTNLDSTIWGYYGYYYGTCEIKDLTVENSYAKYSLFGYGPGTPYADQTVNVTDVTVKNCEANGGTFMYYTGAGHINFTNCVVESSLVHGPNNMGGGGFVGNGQGITINNCKFGGSIVAESTNMVAGFVGQGKATIKNSEVTSGTVIRSIAAGGNVAAYDGQGGGGNADDHNVFNGTLCCDTEAKASKQNSGAAWVKYEGLKVSDFELAEDGTITFVGENRNFSSATISEYIFQRSDYYKNGNSGQSGAGAYLLGGYSCYWEDLIHVDSITSNMLYKVDRVKNIVNVVSEEYAGKIACATADVPNVAWTRYYSYLDRETGTLYYDGRYSTNDYCGFIGDSATVTADGTMTPKTTPKGDFYIVIKCYDKNGGIVGSATLSYSVTFSEPA